MLSFCLMRLISPSRTESEMPVSALEGLNWSWPSMPAPVPRGMKRKTIAAVVTETSDTSPVSRRIDRRRNRWSWRSADVLIFSTGIANAALARSASIFR